MKDHQASRYEQDKRAGEVDDRFAFWRRWLVEDIHAHMGIAAECPRGPKEENERVHVNHALLHPYPAKLEGVTQYDDGEGNQYHGKGQPRQEAGHPLVDDPQNASVR